MSDRGDWPSRVFSASVARAVADQAAQPVLAGDLGGPGQQRAGRGGGAECLAVEGGHDQVERTAAKRELVPVDHAGDLLAVGEEVGQVQVVVRVVGRRQPQPPDRLQPAPDPGAQRAGRPARPEGIGPHLVPVIEQHVRDVAGEVALARRDRGVGLQFDQPQHLLNQPPVQRGRGSTG